MIVSPTILIIGKNGQIGWELQRTLGSMGAMGSMDPIESWGKIISLDHQQLDLTSIHQIRRTIQQIKPAIIVNAAAYTAVDKAEQEQGLAMTINRDAPCVLAEESKAIGALLIHYSTDYVFDGHSTTPYLEQDQTNPINIYGKTKLAGEQAIIASGANYLIFRTSWVYGARNSNFLTTMLRLFKTRDKLSIVDDQIGAPTWCRTIAETTASILLQSANQTDSKDFFAEKSGLYNLTANDYTSWFRFAETITKYASTYHLADHTPTLTPISSSEYATPAKRPLHSMLNPALLQTTFDLKLPLWEKQLRACIESIMESMQNKA